MPCDACLVKGLDRKRSGLARKPPHSFQNKTGLILASGAALAVHAAVYALFPVRKLEDMRDLLLGRGDAARVLALDDVHHAFRQFYRELAIELAVAHDAHGDAGVDIAEHIEVEVNQKQL